MAKAACIDRQMPGHDRNPDTDYVSGHVIRYAKRAFMILIACTLLTFCTAALAESFEITGITPAVNGNLKITWTDPDGNAPYLVLFQPISSVNEQAPTGELIVWCNSGEVTETEYTESYVTADASWWFIIQDGTGRQTAARYDAQDYEHDLAWAVELSGRSQVLLLGSNIREYRDTGDDTSFMIRIDSEKVLAAQEETYYGITMRMSALNDSAYGDYLLKFVVEGHEKTADLPMVLSFTTDTSEPLVLSREYPAQESFVPMNGFVERIVNQYGENAKGVYILKVYFDGRLIGSLPFKLI